MQYSTILTLVIVVVAAASAAWFTARLMQYRQAEDPEQPVFDPARYAPMQRLLDPSDIEFLASQPGVTPDRIARFKRERRAIFRTYLHELAQDFETLHRQARELMAVSPDSNSELVENLVRMQASFWFSLVSIELQLSMDAVGLGHVNPSRILEAVDQLSAALQRATVMPGPVPVA